jgi:hypothetical protein
MQQTRGLTTFPCIHNRGRVQRHSSTPQELDALIRKKIAGWAEVAKAANIKAE